MKTLKTTFVIFLLAIGFASCEKRDPISLLNSSDGNDYLSSAMQNKACIISKATGSVEFLWKGGEKGGEMGNKPENLLAFFSFEAHEGNSGMPSKGEIIYQVKQPDLTMHREIIAQVLGVKVIDTKAWFTAIVTSDTKGCQGNGDGGHDENCSGSDHTDDGGSCGDETDSHDGGCSDGGTNEGGCSDSGSEEEGHGSIGGSGSPGGSMGNPLSGKNCRLGQIIAVKVHDVGSPGLNDGLTWKWFSPTASFAPSIDNIDLWPHLCKKTIIGGNLVVHN